MIEPIKELSADVLLGVLAQSANATAIYVSKDLHIQFANDAMLKLWGKDRSILGKTLAEAVPELEGQPFIDLLKNVWNSRKPYIGTEIPASLNVGGATVTSYFDFEYQPIVNDAGKTYSILHIAADVTDRITYKHLAKEKEERERQLNEELSAANEELQAANEEQAVVNEELQSLNEEYLATNDQLNVVDQERRVLNETLSQTNEELQALNEEYITTNEQLNRLNENYLSLNDELTVTNEELQALNEEITVTSEELRVVNDERLTLNEELTATNEELQLLNEEYLALNDKVNIALETANLAKTAANLGTFDLDIPNDKLEWDARCKELFGLNPSVQVTYSVDFVKGLHRDDKKRVLQAVADAYDKDLTDGRYDIEYRTVGAEDKKLRWVRAIGKVSFDNEKKPVRFIGSVIDITEQKEDELRKNDFIGMVSHELKTPLTSLSGFLQVMQLKVKKLEDGSLTNMVDKSVQQIKKMTTMINGFLDVSRFESGKIHIDFREFDLAELVREVEEESLAIFTSHKIVFHPMERTIIMADRDKIGQVINNLIGNAVKYSPQGTEINVAVISENGFAKASITDQGMGIAEKDLGKLFDRYYRVEGSHMKSISGFGIGLYLSCEIIKRHNGEINATSEVGKGSTFWFKLPLASVS